MIFGRAYPDVDAVIYPTTAPPRYVARVTTRNGAPDGVIHDHIAFVSAAGRGVTDTVVGHYHRVEGGKVLPAAGHTHALTILPAGAG